MRTILLKHHSSARVWLDSVPLEAALVGPMSRLYHCSSPHVVNMRSAAAVEWYRPVGPMSLYGLLGVEYSPNPNELEINLRSENSQRIYMSSLARIQSETPTIGLKPHFQDGVVNGMLLSLREQAAFPSGSLCVTAAVCGAVGSSSKMFENIARVVTKLLLTTSDPSDDDLAALLKISW